MSDTIVDQCFLLCLCVVPFFVCLKFLLLCVLGRMVDIMAYVMEDTMVVVFVHTRA